MTNPTPERVQEIRQDQQEHCLTRDACCDACALVNHIAELEKERDGYQRTLALWDQECGGKSPRELVNTIAALEAQAEQHVKAAEMLQQAFAALEARVRELQALLRQRDEEVLFGWP
jgi:chromosome segregation ATPase